MLCADPFSLNVKQLYIINENMENWKLHIAYLWLFVGDHATQNSQNIPQDWRVQFQDSLVIRHTFDVNVRRNGFLQEWYYRANATRIINQIGPETEINRKMLNALV